MRRTFPVFAVLILAATGCSGPAESPATPAATTAVAAPAVTAGDPELNMTPLIACETVDAAYHTLGPASQAQILKGVRAERIGDKATVAEVLANLEPLWTSTSATFADAASKVSDPALKAALTSLSESVAKAADFTTFAEFDQLAALTAPAEATLKQVCPAHGYQLKNIE
ncbi:hypothetical protein WEI85_36045 [Actinomycetes bacterium KLBMP 9797]